MLRGLIRCFRTVHFLHTSHFIDDTCGLILGFSWGAALPLRWISIEWTRSHSNFPRYLTWRHDTIRTFSPDHLINAEGPFLQQANLSMFMPALVIGPKVFILLDHFFELFLFLFISIDSFFWSSRFFCNVREMKWSFRMKKKKKKKKKKHSAITCQNINLNSPTVRTISIWPWRHSVFFTGQMLDILSNSSVKL